MKAFKPLDNWTPPDVPGKRDVFVSEYHLLFGSNISLSPWPLFLSSFIKNLPSSSSRLRVSTSHSVYTFYIDQVSEN